MGKPEVTDFPDTEARLALHVPRGCEAGFVVSAYGFWRLSSLPRSRNGRSMTLS